MVRSLSMILLNIDFEEKSEFLPCVTAWRPTLATVLKKKQAAVQNWAA